MPRHWHLIALAFLALRAVAQTPPAELPLNRWSRDAGPIQGWGRESLRDYLGSGAGAEPAASRVGQAELRGLVGQSLDVAIRRLGYPDAERTVAGKRLIVWERREQVETVAQTCKVTLEVTPRLITKGVNLDGQHGACMPYLQRLADTAK